jgi:hypothetical protein
MGSGPAPAVNGPRTHPSVERYRLAKPSRPCGLPADSRVRTGTLRSRALEKNRFSGSVPPTISALTALTQLCVPFARPGSPPMRRLRRCASA